MKSTPDIQKTHRNVLKLLGEYNKWNKVFDNEKIEMIYGKNDFCSERIYKYFPAYLFPATDELTTSVRCMQWVHERCSYGNYANYIGEINVESIFQSISQKRISTNCFIHAFVFVNCMISLGFRARLVTCLQIDCLPYDNHVMAEIYFSRLEKWVLMDPTYCLYFMDDTENILNLIEFRKAYIKETPYKIICKNRFCKIEKNGSWNEKKYLDTLCYNLYILEFYIYNTGVYCPNACIRLVPEFFCVGNTVKRNVTAADQRIFYTNKTHEIYSALKERKE